MKPKKLKLRVRCVSWVMQLVIVWVLGYAAFLKLSGHGAEVELFAKLGMEPTGRYVIGFLEAAACVLLILPNAAVYGAILTFGVMMGAVIAHLTKIGFEGSTSLLAVLVLVLAGTIIFLRRRQIPSIARMLD